MDSLITLLLKRHSFTGDVWSVEPRSSLHLSVSEGFGGSRTASQACSLLLQSIAYRQITVSRGDLKFSNYPPGLDVNSISNGSNGKYIVVELTGDITEQPYLMLGSIICLADPSTAPYILPV
ncbi:uncharacterized protein BDR25DRAFT_387233 [Lindgomyces ingoldianus]|uniref:Uncharacterized protein n=1 Tax=Lindgomyces ingoldianus TaxID=673940 RepID=A0ACB6R1U2_9PLEO|nr:uncharacterized protein BDR25DRAFT_387233 [Lindgomyces ingoldianus]KAF2473111.1 hypothetical protein BDR25DRAFT_387233 [Lindgomyces ingoldianus]